MTTYTPITDGAIDQDSPITVGLMTALRDNPIAIAEGDPSAPRINGAIAAAAAPGDVGTYATLIRASNTNTDYSLGDTASGSSLSPAGIEADTPYTTFKRFLIQGTTMSGVWQCMGYSVNDGTGERSITTWVRIY